MSFCSMHCHSTMKEGFLQWKLTQGEGGLFLSGGSHMADVIKAVYILIGRQ